MSIEGMRRRGVWLTKNQIVRLKALAERTGLKASEHIRRAIDSYLDSQQAKESDREI